MNHVDILGRLTRDPQVRYTTNGKVVSTFTLAVNRPWKNKDGTRDADFIPVVVWGKVAELIGNGTKKGHRLSVDGRIQVRSYPDKEDQSVTHWITEVIAEHVEFIEPKNKDGAEAFTPLGTEVPMDEDIPF